jgi:hypothetical protein
VSSFPATLFYVARPILETGNESWRFKNRA